MYRLRTHLDVDNKQSAQSRCKSDESPHSPLKLVNPTDASTCRNASSINNLHNNTRRVTTIVHVKVFRCIQEVHAELLGFKGLGWRIRFGHLWSEELN